MWGFPKGQDGSVSYPPSSLLTLPALTLSGANADIPGIPERVRKISIGVSSLSTSGANRPMLQLGKAAGFLAAGYLGAVNHILSANTPTVINHSTGFQLVNGFGGAGDSLHGIIELSRIGDGDLWAFMSQLGSSTGLWMQFSSGSVDLLGPLTGIRFTTTTGVDTYDGGTVQAMVWR